MGVTYKPIEAFLEPFIGFARYLPASAFIPLLILWAGIGEAQKLAVIFIGSSLVRRVLLPGATPELPAVAHGAGLGVSTLRALKVCMKYA